MCTQCRVRQLALPFLKRIGINSPAAGPGCITREYQSTEYLFPYVIWMSPLTREAAGLKQWLTYLDFLWTGRIPEPCMFQPHGLVQMALYGWRMKPSSFSQETSIHNYLIIYCYPTTAMIKDTSDVLIWRFTFKATSTV